MTTLVSVRGVNDRWAEWAITDPGFFRLKVSYFRKQTNQAEDSPKKRTKTRRILVKTNLFVRFLEESSARKETFRDYLTFRN